MILPEMFKYTIKSLLFKNILYPPTTNFIPLKNIPFLQVIDILEPLIK